MRLRRTVEMVLLLAVMATAVGVFGVKTDTAREAEEIRDLSAKIAQERQRISELTAEWSALDHPARIQELLERHADVLTLAPITPHQIDAIDRVPFAPPPATLAGSPDEGPEE